MRFVFADGHEENHRVDRITSLRSLGRFVPSCPARDPFDPFGGYYQKHLFRLIVTRYPDDRSRRHHYQEIDDRES